MTKTHKNETENIIKIKVNKYYIILILYYTYKVLK